jgi:hypothetical protein
MQTPCRDVLRAVAGSHRAVFAVDVPVFLLKVNCNGETSQMLMMTNVRVGPWFERSA